MELLTFYWGIAALKWMPTVLLYACALTAILKLIRGRTRPYITGTITGVAFSWWLATAAFWAITSAGIEPLELTPEEAAIVFDPGANATTTVLLLRDRGGVNLDRLAAETNIQTVIRSADRGEAFCTGTNFLTAQLRPGLKINTYAWKPLGRLPANYIVFDACPKTGIKEATRELIEYDKRASRLLNVSFPGRIGDRIYAIFPPVLMVNGRGIAWATSYEGGGVITTEASREKETTNFIVRGING